MLKIAACLALTGLAVAGCSPDGSAHVEPTMTGPATATSAPHPAPDPAPTPATPADPALRVGAIFDTRTGGHYCTGSVVGRDLVITAAHCLFPSGASHYQRKISFVPQWRRGHQPAGRWVPARMLVLPGWIRSADPDLDVGFMTVEPLHGRHIGDLLGQTALAFGTGFDRTVRITGYPADRNSAATCVNRARRFSATQLRIACHNFTTGTSGAPWVAHDPATGTPEIIGVLGGHLTGGNSPNVSYACGFGAEIQALYARAVKTL
ncbi:MAG: trypsin-like peptidase domain-containing protein [Streptosporangiaceae bacterium]